MISTALKTHHRVSIQTRYPHRAGVRSARLAASIATLAPQERTPVQERLLRQHEQGACIGCTEQGVPRDSAGDELRLRYEPNGFAAPPAYCDCPRGQ